MKALNQIKINKGIYVLEFQLFQKCTLPIKKFLNSPFPPGYYYYIGSAQKNLKQRLGRHALLEKNVYWHIDYITSNPIFEPSNIFVFEDKSKNFECELVQILKEKFKLNTFPAGFGNSDCNRCVSHLLYGKIRVYSQLLDLYQSTVLCIPSSRDKD